MQSVIQFELGLGSNLVPSQLTAAQLATVMSDLSRTVSSRLIFLKLLKIPSFKIMSLGEFFGENVLQQVAEASGWADHVAVF